MHFWKYQGAGNDFIMLDQRKTRWVDRGDKNRIAQYCDRHFGIGADGLIVLQDCPGYDFEMVYFNADGGESTLCGNGGRCIAAFARDLGIVSEKARFLAIDGPHEAIVRPAPDGLPRGAWVELHMGDVTKVERDGDDFVLNTGSPHFVRFVGNTAAVDVVGEGRAIRYAERFKPGGLNVNFAAPGPDGRLAVRTYERGVEDETLACGTGVTAAVIAHCLRQGVQGATVETPVTALGGQLSVRLVASGDAFTNVWLCGPAQRVFEGVWPE